MRGILPFLFPIHIFTSANFHVKIDVEKKIPSDVSEFYDWFFLSVRTLEVINVMDQNSSKIHQNQHMDSMLVSLGVNRRNMKVSDMILQKIFQMNTETSKETVVPESNVVKSWKIEESYEKLRIYADFNRGFVLIAPSVILALTYFQIRYKYKMFYHRDISLVFISDTSCLNERLENQIIHLMKMAWNKHGLLNMVVQTVCNFTPKFHIYRPLVFKNGTYGRLDSYYLGDVLNNPTVTLNSLKNLNNVSLKVNLFYRYPTAMKVSESVPSHVSTCYDVLQQSNYVGGVEGCTLGHLAKTLNFTPIIEDIDGQGINRFGHIFPNGSLTGSLADVNQRRTDIAMNGVFLDYKYTLFNVEFSKVTQSDQICPVVPKSTRVPAWACILRVFSLWTWISIEILASLMCLYIDVSSSKTSRGLYYMLFKNSSINTNKNWRYRLVVALYLFVFHVILAGIFNGHLFRNFSTISYYPDINSLQDLADSDLSIETTLNIFHDDERESDLIRKLAEKVVKNYHGTSPAIERAAFYRNIVALERKEEAMLKIYTKYLDQNGFPLLHVLDDCIMTQFISKILPEGSPFLPVFNMWFSRFDESGLSGKWASSLMLPPRNRSVVEGGNPRLGLDKVVLVFLVLLVGVLLSTVVFVGEVLFHKIQSISG